MKQGIHLGPARPRGPSLGAVALLGGALAALVLGIFYLRAYREVSALRGEIERRERVLPTENLRISTERSREVSSRLRDVLDSGAADGLSPTALLRFVASALPEDVVLSSLAIDGTSTARSVTLEATAIGGERVSELQRRLSQSPRVSKTSLLEERRLPEGGLAVRLAIELEGPEVR